ncbi:hypothetical protein IMZ48_47875, partial [Candidatus Bathyarchaeota archaeon]|nr:hypothetical protein [Candidatus Bathyarchaeota archaeon]
MYSPQKPMGRPKKRRHVELNQPDELLDQWALHESTDGDFLQLQSSSVSSDPSGLGKASQAYNPLDMMPVPALDLPFAMAPQSQLLTDPFLDMDLSIFQSVEFGGFDFNDTSDDSALEIPLTRGTVHRIFEAIGTFIFANSTTAKDCPKLPEAPPTTANSPSKSYPNATCPCLSSIYLALESLTSIPDDLPKAINVARKASKTAHDVIVCPVCGTPLTEDPLAPPPIQPQQNMFLLSALLSSLTNAYTRLLELVDATAESARSPAPTNLHFSLRELGGSWAGIPGGEGGACMLSRGIDEADLPPGLWRLAMRAVLRYEVYGFCVAPDDPLCGGDGGQSGHLGLARAVRRLEERSVARHEVLDR